jgi:hypothetical protein
VATLPGVTVFARTPWGAISVAATQFVSPTQAIISLDVALDAVEQIRRIVPAGFFSTVTYAVLFPLLGKNIKSSKTLQVSQFPP